MADKRRACGVIGLFWLAACAQPMPVQMAAGPAQPPAPEQQGFQQCVPYARRASGIELYGDAWSWWQAAAGRYERGSAPLPGAVLVMKRDGRLTRGHVAVVTEVVGLREIRITHANWAFGDKPGGLVDRDVSVVDVSPGNDWSRIRVWNGGSYGRVYHAYGFVYPGAPAQAI